MPTGVKVNPILPQGQQVSRRSDRVHLILGGYYFDQSDNTRDTRQLPADALTRATANSVIALNAACARSPICAQPVPIAIALPRSRDANNIDITNKAMFGSIGFDITSELSLSVEGRYAEEKITQSTLDFDAGAVVPAPVIARAKFTEFTPRATLSSGWPISAGWPRPTFPRSRS